MEGQIVAVIRRRDGFTREQVIPNEAEFLDFIEVPRIFGVETCPADMAYAPQNKIQRFKAVSRKIVIEYREVY